MRVPFRTLALASIVVVGVGVASGATGASTPLSSGGGISLKQIRSLLWT
jgi:hypothetical protein